MKKIETIDLIIYGGITILAIFLLIFLGVDSSPIDNLHTSPGLPTNYPSLPIHSDPILGNWILPNNETRHLEDITFEQYGNVSKTKYHGNLSFTEDIGFWTKVSENRYFIQWQTEQGDSQVNGSFIPFNETILYDPSANSINANGIVHIRDIAIL